MFYLHHKQIINKNYSKCYIPLLNVQLMKCVNMCCAAPQALWASPLVSPPPLCYWLLNLGTCSQSRSAWGYKMAQELLLQAHQPLCCCLLTPKAFVYSELRIQSIAFVCDVVRLRSEKQQFCCQISANQLFEVTVTCCV